MNEPLVEALKALTDEIHNLGDKLAEPIAAMADTQVECEKRLREIALNIDQLHNLISRNLK